MFVLYAILVGLVLGTLLGGAPERLGGIRFRSAGLIVAGLVTQLVLFSGPVAEHVHAVGPAVYVASTGLVLAAVVRNAMIPGLPLVAAGASLNLAAIVANGGYMPASAAALGAHGFTSGAYSNSVVLSNPALAPFTDVMALPGWVPFANVFSIGDVAIMVGIVVAIVVQMRARETVDIRDRIVRFGPLGRPALAFIGEDQGRFWRLDAGPIDGARRH
jgi:hypothetical protein